MAPNINKNTHVIFTIQGLIALLVFISMLMGVSYAVGSDVITTKRDVKENSKRIQKLERFQERMQKDIEKVKESTQSIKGILDERLPRKVKK